MSGPVPAISVVIATYNRADLVERSVRSILDGALKQVEVIVVDDGSTDETAAVLSRIADARLSVITQENRGRTAARNRGVEHATGRYVTFLDSDDRARPDWLAQMQAAFEQHDSVGVVSCGCVQRWLLPNGGEARRHVEEPKQLGPLFHSQVALFLTGTFAARRDLFESIGGYNETMERGETTELALRLVPAALAKSLTFESTTEPLICYEQCRSPMTARDHQARQRDAETMLRVHGSWYLAHGPNRRSHYFAIAGASAAHLGDLRAARRHFASAVRDDPKHLRGYGRLALSMAAPVASRVWQRPDT